MNITVSMIKSYILLSTLILEILINVSCKKNSDDQKPVISISGFVEVAEDITGSTADISIYLSASYG